MFGNWSAKRKKRFKRRIYVILFICFVAFMFTLWFKIVYSPRFLLTDVKIIAPYHEYVQIYKIIDNEIHRENIFLPPSNLLFFNKEKIRSQILFSVPEINEVLFSYNFKDLNSLETRIGLRKYKYTFCDKDDKLYKVDDTGFIYEKLINNDTKGLIICSKPEGTNMSIQKDYPVRFKIKYEDLNYVYKIEKAFENFDIKPKRIVFLPEKELEVYFNDFKLKLVADDTISEQIVNFKTAWNSSLKNIKVEYVDARFDPRVYYKPIVSP